MVHAKKLPSIDINLTREGSGPRNGGADLKVLCFSSLFPNEAQPRHGIFLRHRLTHLALMDGIRLKVMAPVPWFPSTHPYFGRYSVYRRAPQNSEQQGLAVSHPRYPVLPKIGMTVAALLMAAAMLPKLLKMRRSGFDFDVIDSYYLYPDGVAAVLLGLLLNRPAIVTAFGSDVNLLPNYASVRAQILWATKRSAGITAVCGALKNGLVRLGAVPDKVHVIPHGVDLNLFKPPTDRAALRRHMGFGQRTLISVGHLIPRKGNEFAIAALVELPETNLVIVGDGPEEAALRRLSAKLGIADRVKFLGHVDQSLIPELLGASDALLLCSDREGVANVAMEALACGTPVVATPVWGMPEILNQQEAGILIKDRSVSAVVEGVRSLFLSPPDRASTRKYAESFDWSKATILHAGLIREVAHAKPSFEAVQPVPIPQL